MKKYLVNACFVSCIYSFAFSSQALAATLVQSNQVPPTDKVTLFGAGSLRAALGEVAQNFEQIANVNVETSFAFSGLQRERIENGERPDIFASADINNPLLLYQQGLSKPVVKFTANRLVAVTNSNSELTTDNFLSILNANQIGTFPPATDPLGAYTQDVYRKVDAILPGSFERLNKKSIFFKEELVPPDKFTSGGLIAWGLQEAPEDLKVDVFISYYTSALAALAIQPNLKVIELPDNLAVQADYGLTVVKGASPKGQELADYILSPEAQAVLAKYGFSPVNVTQSVPEHQGFGGVILALSVAFAIQKKLAAKSNR